MLPEPAREREPELGDITLALDLADGHSLAAGHANGLTLARQVERGELAGGFFAQRRHPQGVREGSRWGAGGAWRRVGLSSGNRWEGCSGAQRGERSNEFTTIHGAGRLPQSNG